MDDTVRGEKSMPQHGNGQTPTPEHGNYSELAEANLLRLRGRYKDALDKCTELLKQTPKDPTLHVLIGDIYRDQGQISEAVQWYQMALDLDPDNPEYAEKLEKLEQQEAKGGERWQWWHWILLTTATALVAVALGAGLAWKATRSQVSQEPPSTPTQPAVSPAEMPPGLRTPSNTPQSTPPASASPGFAPNQQQTPPSKAGGSEEERSALRETLSSSEQALLQLISQSVRQELGDRLVVSGFIMDPRTHSAVVTVNKSAVPATREALSIFLAEVRTVALWTLSLVGSADSVTIRALSRFPLRKGVSGPIEVIFIGDAERKTGSLQQSDPSQWFTQQWWHPRLAALVPGQNVGTVPSDLR
ncbi:MAG: tetratricopeptide repeat protein [Armatimonadota bacterium]